MPTLIREPKKTSEARPKKAPVSQRNTYSRTLEMPASLLKVIDSESSGSRSSLVDKFLRLSQPALRLQTNEELERLKLSFNEFKEEFDADRSTFMTPAQIGYLAYQNCFNQIRRILMTDHFSLQYWEKRSYTLGVDNRLDSKLWESIGYTKRPDLKFLINSIVSLVIVSDIASKFMNEDDPDAMPSLETDLEWFREWFAYGADTSARFIEKTTFDENGKLVDRKGEPLPIEIKNYKRLREHIKDKFLEAFMCSYRIFFTSFLEKIPVVDPSIRKLARAITTTDLKTSLLPLGNGLA